MQRKHTTTACQLCRDHKTKCDGVRPKCGSCSRKGKACVYSDKDDKRKVSLRTAVDVLLNRVGQLTDLAVTNAIQLPSIEQDQRSLIELVCYQFELPIEKVFPEANDKQWYPPENLEGPMVPVEADGYVCPMDHQSMGSATLVNGIASDQSLQFDMHQPIDLFSSDSWSVSPSDWPWQLLNDVNIEYDVSGLPIDLTSKPAPTQERGSYADDPTNTAATSDDEVETTIVPDLAARFGSLRMDAEGRVRFYGTASNQHLFANSSSQRENSMSRRDKERNVAHALEVSQLDREIPDDLQDQLLRLFFEWHNTCHTTVNRSLFEAARAENAKKQSQYCSESLIAAMCAIGAAFEGQYHPTFVTFPKPLPEFFADKSKILLELEIDSPYVSTVQTMLLLSSHEAGAGRDTRMWLYSGMAARLSFDLGLHIDSDPYVKAGMFTSAESEARRTTFWSCVVVNQLWSFSLGRPFRVDSEELTIKRAFSSTVANAAKWPELPSVSAAISPLSAHPELSLLLLEQWVNLAEEMAPLVRVLYGCVKISKTTLQTLSNETTSRLLSWRETIAPVLRIQSEQPTLPQVLLLHMAYHNFCILVHRPWTSRSSQPPGGLGPGYQHARNICRNAASEIAGLLRLYESQWGSRKMNVYVITIIFSASLILIFGLTSSAGATHAQEQEENVRLAGDLNTCFRALEELGRSFESAKRTRDRLLELQQLWSQRKEDARIKTKRTRGHLPEPLDDSGKRIRNS